MCTLKVGVLTCQLRPSLGVFMYYAMYVCIVCLFLSICDYFAPGWLHFQIKQQQKHRKGTVKQACRVSG